MGDPFHVINERSCHHLKMKRWGWTRASLLANFKFDFKHVVFFFMDELMSLPYMDEKLEMSSFQPKFNCSKIPSISLDMVQRVHGDPIWKICFD
jgi:hypothetical protein